MFYLLDVNPCFPRFVFVNDVVLFVGATLSLVVLPDQSSFIANFYLCSAIFSEGSVFLCSPPSGSLFNLFVPRVFFFLVILMVHLLALLPPVCYFLVHVVIFGGTLPFVYRSCFFPVPSLCVLFSLFFIYLHGNASSMRKLNIPMTSEHLSCFKSNHLQPAKMCPTGKRALCRGCDCLEISSVATAPRKCHRFAVNIFYGFLSRRPRAIRSPSHSFLFKPAAAVSLRILRRRARKGGRWTI